MIDNISTCHSARNGQPLVAYGSMGEAVAAADYVKTRYGSAQEPYQCEKCGLWHLSPKGRQTPSRTCVSCQKELYATMDAAKKRARIIELERGVKLDIYKCPFNSGYHLTDSCKRKKKR